MSTPFSSSILSRRDFLKGAAMTGVMVACQAPACLLASVPAEAITETHLLMNTFVTISVVTPSKDQATEALGRAFERITHLEAVFSRFDTASPLHVFNEKGRMEDAPQELAELLARAQRFGSLTGGAFDVTVTPVVDLYRTRQNPGGIMHLDLRDLAEARHLVHAPSLHVEGHHLRLDRQGMAVTLDGIAKGHIADVASETLAQCGVVHHLVNAGGDIRARGHKALSRPWMVAVDNPTRTRGASAPVETLPLTEAIATSGSYEMYYDASRQYHHLVEPASGASPTRVRSVSVTAPTAMQADALATAFSVMIPQDALRLAHSLPGVQCCILGGDGLRMVSSGWGKA